MLRYAVAILVRDELVGVLLQRKPSTLRPSFVPLTVGALCAKCLLNDFLVALHDLLLRQLIMRVAHLIQRVRFRHLQRFVRRRVRWLARGETLQELLLLAVLRLFRDVKVHSVVAARARVFLVIGLVVFFFLNYILLVRVVGTLRLLRGEFVAHLCTTSIH